MISDQADCAPDDEQLPQAADRADAGIPRRLDIGPEGGGAGLDRIPRRLRGCLDLGPILVGQRAEHHAHAGNGDAERNPRRGDDCGGDRAAERREAGDRAAKGARNEANQIDDASNGGRRGSACDHRPGLAEFVFHPLRGVGDRRLDLGPIFIGEVAQCHQDRANGDRHQVQGEAKALMPDASDSTRRNAPINCMIAA